MEVKNANTQNLKTPAKFAEMKNIARTFVYKLIEKQEIDYAIIDGVTFIVMNEKAKNYNKTR
jgi:hypothetical protein